jgi:hypothetical protein
MFGCGEASGSYRFTDDVANAALNGRQADRLWHMDALRQDHSMPFSPPAAATAGGCCSLAACSACWRPTVNSA